MRFSFDTKRIRYAYWVTMAFVKKNMQSLLLSFLLSLLGVITVVSFAPYVIDMMTTDKQVIGISGMYTIDTLPDEIVANFSNGLLHVNDKGELIPLLADSWEPVDGGREYRFHIKKDLTWNDGSSFTANDIQYKFKDVETIAESDYMLRFKLKKPLAIFPNFLTKPIMKYPVVGVAGVYKVGRIRLEAGNVKMLQLTPNQEGLPILIYKFYDTDSKLVQAYKLGEITQMTTTKASVAEVFKDWKNTKIEQSVDYSKVMTLFFNFNDPLLKEEKDLRHAVAEAIDKSAFGSYGEPAFSPLPPTSWAYENNVKQYPYNPNVASKIIKKYTEASGAAELKISTYYDHLAVADDIKENLRDMGFEPKIEVLSGSLPRDYQIFVAQLTLGKDPDQYFFWHSTQTSGNITAYKNVRIDKLLEDGRNTYAIAKRKEFYSDFQRILVEDMPAHFLYYPYSYTIKRK